MTQEYAIDTPRGLCCWFMKYGKCDPPRPPCRFRHVDPGRLTGREPCCFGATCRLGHAKRVLPDDDDPSAKLAFWKRYNNQKNKDDDDDSYSSGDGLSACSRTSAAVVGDSPAVRDATLLRSQLEPWPTAVLRDRLARFTGIDHRDLDPLGRAELMRRLMEYYDARVGPRRVLRVQPSTPPVRDDLRAELLRELEDWRNRHAVNTRPSINAEAYMILRSPMEFGAKDSNKARQAAKKLAENERLWTLAHRALEEVDPDYASTFSALAVTYNFTGSPHIDKQNTGPCYGLALGDFPDGQGCICVEADPVTVAHVDTKNRLAKVDGRYPHWVAPYDEGSERYSLIYYSTWQAYAPPTTPYFVDEPTL